MDLSGERNADGSPAFDCATCPDRVRYSRSCPLPVENKADFPDHPTGPNECPLPEVTAATAFALRLSSDRWTMSPADVSFHTFQALTFVGAEKGRRMRR